MAAVAAAVLLVVPVDSEIFINALVLIIVTIQVIGIGKAMVPVVVLVTAIVASIPTLPARLALSGSRYAQGGA